jgi:hypothetical protein
MEADRMDKRNVAVWKFGLVFLVLMISSGAKAQQQSAFFNDSDNINVVNRWSSADDPSNGAVTDYNGDGFKDLFIPFRGTTRIGEVLEGQSIQGHRPIFNSIAPILFEGSGVNPGCTGIVFADFNNDGYSDFYAPNIGGHQLFKFNPTTGKYEDIAGSISTPGGFNSTISGSWGDFNADGWIDLLLLKYSDTYLNVHPYSNEQRLLINNGGQGFTLVGAVDTGIDNVTTGIVNALWCDFSGDGYVDLALIQGVNYPNASSKYFQNEWSSGPQGHVQAGRLQTTTPVVLVK